MNPTKSDTINLILISFLALFLELAMIRWLPANVMSLTYFSNIVLISSIFGLGLGALSASRGRDTFRWFPLILLVVINVFLSLKLFEVVIPNPKNEVIWSYLKGNGLNAFKWRIGILLTLILTYVFNSLLFLLIGRRLANLLNRFRPLTAYGLELLGSILGIVAFGLLSIAGYKFASPLIWFSLVSLITLWLLKKERLFLGIAIICLLSVVALVYTTSQNEIWSPYYSLQTRLADHGVTPSDGSTKLYVNRFFHQEALNFTNYPEVKDKYSLPYQLKQPSKVLILGSGLGNDVAIANFNQVAQIDAVEIDPVILRLGQKLHPNQPYDNPKVRVYVDDARSFLKKNQEKYDMIILATLDSHALLSGMSTIRLDSFVYTKESLQDIKRHLKPDGLAVLMFSMGPNSWLSLKMINSVSAVFNEPLPLVFLTDKAFLFNFMLVAGPGLNNILADKSIDTSQFLQVAEPVAPPATKNLTTDNWPYLYLLEHALPWHYLKTIIFLLLVSLASIAYLAPNKKPSWQGLNFFCLGVAFLLLETKSITTLSLLFGSTWLVNIFVFGSILLMALLANLLVAKINIKRIWTIYLLLGLSLLLNYLVPASAFLGQTFWLKSVLPSLLTALPLFFGSMIFSWHFRSVLNPAAFYGLNLAGMVLGGFLEYSSMMVGLNKLYLIALVFYLVSFLSYIRKSDTTTD
jgi:predicted membrane-bound spermidine synthase